MPRLLILAAAMAFTPLMALAQAATMYKSAWCGCCTGHAEYLAEHGYDVEIVELEGEALAAIKQEHAVPHEQQGCHTLVIDGYAIEGHVPVEAIQALLDQRPDIAGITLPGMPAGSPGMGGTKTAPFQILVIGSDGRVFMEV